MDIIRVILGCVLLVILFPLQAIAIGCFIDSLGKAMDFIEEIKNRKG